MYTEEQTQEKMYDRPQNVIMSIPLIDLKVYKRRNDDPDKTYDTIGEIPWDLIDFPVQTSRQNVLNDPNARGMTVIGYIDSVDSEYFNVVIFGKYAELVSTFEDPVLVPKTTINNNGRAVINSIQIGPLENFEYLTRPPKEYKPRNNYNNKRFNNRRQYDD